MADATTEQANAAAFLLARGWTQVEVDRLLSGPPTGTSPPKGEPEPTLSLSWTLASYLFEDKPDPYNAAAINAAMRDKRAGSDSHELNLLQRGLETAMTLAMASTGYGAVVGIVFELLKLLVNYIVPLSSGGYDKLTTLQRQKGNLYGLLPAFEESRNKRIYPSQFIDLSIHPPGYPDTTYGGTQPAPSRDSPIYRIWVRNLLIRIAYNNEFKRVVLTEDEPVLPVIMINLLHKNKLWPPPLPPVPIRRETYFAQFDASNPARWVYYDLTELDQTVLQAEWMELWTLYLADARVFRKAIMGVKFPDDLREMAKKTGCIPEPFSPAHPLYTNFQDIDEDAPPLSAGTHQ